MSRHHWRSSATLVLLTGVLSALVTTMLTPRLAVEARTRVLDAAIPSAVSYHLMILDTRAAAGRVIEGQVSGVLDGAGLLTTTVSAVSSLTATVVGRLSSTDGVSLTMQGGLASVTLHGTVSLAGGASGEALASDGATRVGSWRLAPEPVQLSYAFGGRVTSGRYRGLDLTGRLVIAAEKGEVANFDGRLTLADGTAILATGQMIYGNMELSLYGLRHGVLVGIASLSHRLTLENAPYTLYRGISAGPGSGDSGTWSAARSD